MLKIHLCRKISIEHTTESSSAVRVIEVKSPFVAQSGMVALGQSG
jgi:hypothetical protein